MAPKKLNDVPVDVYVQFVRSLFDNYQMLLVGAACHSIVAFMVFVFVASNVVLLGAEAAAHWPDVRDERHQRDGDGPPLRARVRSAVRGLFVRRG